MAHGYCDSCKKRCTFLTLIYKQLHGATVPMYVCPACHEEHWKLLEQLRENFRRQFGEK